MLYLYYKGERYLVELDKNKRKIDDSVIEILSTLNSMKVTREQVDIIFPTSFTFKKLQTDSRGLSDNFWPNLSAVLTIGKTTTNGRLKDFPAKASRIYREAMFYLSQVDWVYTNDISYENILCKQFGYKSIDVGVRQPFLVPAFFKDKNLDTYITSEVCQDEDICFLEKNL